MFTMLILLSGVTFISGESYDSQEECFSAAAAIAAVVKDPKFDHECVLTKALEEFLEDGEDS